MGRTRERRRDLERQMRQGQADFRRELAATSQPSALRLLDAYNSFLQVVNPTLANIMNLAGTDGMSSRELASAGETLRLQDQVRSGLNDFAQIIEREARRMERAGITGGRNYALDMLIGSDDGISWNRPTVGNIQALINYVDGSAFQQNLRLFGDYYAQQVSNIILVDASQGVNPRTTARHLTKYLQDRTPYYQAENMTRTVQIWSARQGAHEIYRQNRENCLGWWWSSARDGRVCMSCLSMHGKEFPVEETLNDHHRGRCAPIPVTPSWASLGFTDGMDGPGPESGESWFRSLPESQQRSMMGEAKWQAWKNGQFQFDQLSTTYENPVYGTMRREATLQELTGGGFRAPRLPRRPQPNRLSFADQLAHDEASIRDQAFETGIGYDRYGRPVWRVDGEQSRVSFTTQQLEQLRGGTFTHNHPDIPVPPSLQDLTIAQRYDIAEFRAIGRFARGNPINYRVRPPNSGWVSVDLEALQADYFELYEAGMDRERELWINNGRPAITPEVTSRINIRVQSNVIRELSNRYGFEYTTQTANIFDPNRGTR